MLPSVISVHGCSLSASFLDFTISVLDIAYISTCIPVPPRDNDFINKIRFLLLAWTYNSSLNFLV